MANRLSRPGRLTPNGTIQRMYQKTMTHWAADLLGRSPVPGWPEPDPIDDPADRDWRRLYAGSVLDD